MIEWAKVSYLCPQGYPANWSEASGMISWAWPGAPAQGRGKKTGRS